MAVQFDTTSAPPVTSRPSEISQTYQHGIVAGVIGAATIAIWFFIVDIFNGRPFYTPSVLGTALFRHSIALDHPETVPISFAMVLFYTWVHAMIFCAIGGVAAKLLDFAESNVNVGFGILLLLVIFEFGFVGAAFIFAEPILQALAWPTVLVGNLLAATGMATYFWRHHPNLKIEP